MMQRNLVVSGVVVAIIVIAVFIVFQLNANNAPPLDPTIALHPLLTIPGKCDTFNADWSLVAAAGKVYDATTGKLLLTTKSSSTGVRFSPNSAFAGVLGDGVYDMHSGQLLFGLTSAYAPHFSPDNGYVAIVGDGVYELPGGKQIVHLNKSLTEGIAFSPDSRYLANINDGVYDLTTGQRVFAIGGHQTIYVSDTDEAEFSPDGKYLSVGYDGTYQMDTGKKTSEQIDVIAFSADSSLAVTFQGIYDLTSLKRIFPETLGGAQVAISTFSLDEKRVLVQTSDTLSADYPAQITVYDVATRKPLLTVNGVKGYESESVLSPDGKLLANWNDAVYGVESGKKLFALESRNTPLFSKDSSVLFESADGKREGAYDLHTGKLRFSLKAVQGTAYTHVNSLINGIYASSDGRIITDGSTVYESATGAPLADGSVLFQPNGNKVAINPGDAKGSQGQAKRDCQIDSVISLLPGKSQ